MRKKKIVGPQAPAPSFRETVGFAVDAAPADGPSLPAAFATALESRPDAPTAHGAGGKNNPPSGQSRSGPIDKAPSPLRSPNRTLSPRHGHR